MLYNKIKQHDIDFKIERYMCRNFYNDTTPLEKGDI